MLRLDLILGQTLADAKAGHQWICLVRCQTHALSVLHTLHYLAKVIFKCPRLWVGEFHSHPLCCVQFLIVTTTRWWAHTHLPTPKLSALIHGRLCCLRPRLAADLASSAPYTISKDPLCLGCGLDVHIDIDSYELLLKWLLEFLN